MKTSSMSCRTEKLLTSSSIPALGSQKTDHPRTATGNTIFTALRDLASILNAKLTPNLPVTVRTQIRPHSRFFALAGMKFPSSASITSKKNITCSSEEDSSSNLITSIDTTPENMSLPREQKNVLGQPDVLNDSNNNSKETSVSSKSYVDTIENSISTNSMNILNKENQVVKDNRRRLMRKDSGFSSSGSDEDATDKGSRCHCDNMRNRLRPRKLHRQQPHWLSMSRSQSWSSLDSAIVDTADQCGTYSTSETSSPLSSVWSLTSSRNNLSLSPSLDSQLWGSASISCEDTIVSTGSSPKVPAKDTHGCEVNTFETKCNENSNISSEEHSSFNEEFDRDDEFLDSNTQVLGSTTDDRNITIDTILTETDEALSISASEQSYRQIRVRRGFRGRDHNNNTGAHRSVAIREYLPGSPGRLGDCFKKNGLLSLVALIIYTLVLMAVFALIGAAGKSLKAAVGKQDLKEMRRSLAQTRRSRRAPATSG